MTAKSHTDRRRCHAQAMSLYSDEQFAHPLRPHHRAHFPSDIAAYPDAAQDDDFHLPQTGHTRSRHRVRAQRETSERLNSPMAKVPPSPLISIPVEWQSKQKRRPATARDRLRSFAPPISGTVPTDMSVSKPRPPQSARHRSLTSRNSGGQYADLRIRSAGGGGRFEPPLTSGPLYRPTSARVRASARSNDADDDDEPQSAVRTPSSLHVLAISESLEEEPVYEASCTCAEEVEPSMPMHGGELSLAQVMEQLVIQVRFISSILHAAYTACCLWFHSLRDTVRTRLRLLFYSHSSYLHPLLLPLF